MPITPDPATRHDALHRKPDPSGVSVRVTGHTTRPSVALTLARAASGVPAYVTADQVAAMVACATTTRDRLLLRTLWESGGRVSEVASLRLCDIDRAEGALQLTNLKQRGPRRHVKLVYISRDLAGALLAFARDTRLGHDGHHFGSRQSGAGLITRQQVMRIVNHLAIEAGVIVQGRTGPPTRLWPGLPPRVCRAPARVGSSADPRPVPSRPRLRGHHRRLPSAHQPGPAVNR